MIKKELLTFFLMIILCNTTNTYPPALTPKNQTHSTRSLQSLNIALKNFDTEFKKVLPKKLLAHLPADQMILTIPTIITLLRFILCPFIAEAIKSEKNKHTFNLLFISILTDFIDGKLARTLHQETVLGNLLDAIADKITLLTVILASTYSKSTAINLPPWFFSFEIVKELTQGAILSGGYLVTQQEIPHLPLSKVSTATKALWYSLIFIAHLNNQQLPTIKQYGIKTFALLDCMVASLYTKQVLKQLIVKYYTKISVNNHELLTKQLQALMPCAITK